jgi:DNA polymerase/3'-5' exonuclease PolX
MEREHALAIAGEIISLLQPACHRLEIAGSLRRGKDEVKDIELVGLPIWDGDPLKSKKVGHSLLDGILMEEQMLGKLRLDEAVKRDGMKYKRLILTSCPDIVIELFLANAANYGNTLLIRTGSAAWNQLFVTQRLKGGLLPNHLFHKDGYLWRKVQRVKGGQIDSVMLKCPTEEALFEYAGLPMTKPCDRCEETAKWLRRSL